MDKLILFSGIQPSGDLTLGNYISVLSQWINMQDSFKCFFCIADLHALTNKVFDTNKFIFNIISVLISLDININDNILFLQSSVAEHLKLFWIFSSILKFNKIKKIYKFEKDNFNKNVSYYIYSILMTSDILLYNSNIVPIGLDQIKNVSLSKYIANKFNNLYGNIFNIPKFSINSNYIMSLSNPRKKMSKSDNYYSYISLLDNKESIRNKINKCITDSNNPPIIKYDIKNKPGISNLIYIIHKLTNISISEIECEFKNKNYFVFKKYVVDIIFKKLYNIQKKYYIIRDNESYLKKILINGNKNANKIALDRFNIINNLFKKNI
ncbi:tryptophan--tRNA ligase [endosymbiont of Euscepes postfasciatus]|uniref:tryptophan--tRNA ligase n=1 Tax=endosymbiont of Euscepes postfasciatus TaxID=650377 RepID=UPI000DC6FCAF|nr:tryptophan--tRNA ligase [endosymbiont of Euscepes postfasciatus]BBA84584.1 tryptophan--tRNA ligase [endosymbiont of Euscepes postfasciatus]